MWYHKQTDYDFGFDHDYGFVDISHYLPALESAFSEISNLSGIMGRGTDPTVYVHGDNFHATSVRILPDEAPQIKVIDILGIQ